MEVNMKARSLFHPVFGRLTSGSRASENLALFLVFGVCLVCSVCAGCKSKTSELAAFYLESSGLLRVDQESPALGEGDTRALFVWLLKEGKGPEHIAFDDVDLAWSTDNPDVASLEDMFLTAHQAGETVLNISYKGIDTVVPLRVVSDEDAVILDIHIEEEQEERQRGLPPSGWLWLEKDGPDKKLSAIATLETERYVEARDRLLWSSTNSQIVEVDRQGKLKGKAVGLAEVEASLPGGELSSSLAVVVVEVAESGAEILPEFGGLLRSEQAELRVPPGTLEAATEVELGEVFELETIPFPIPEDREDDTFLAGIEITAGTQHDFRIPLEVSIDLESNSLAEAGAIVEILRLENEDSATEDPEWVHASWGKVHEDGSKLEFLTKHLSTFLVLDYSKALQTQAERYAPWLMFSQDDIYPISFEDFVEASELFGALGRVLSTSPQPSDLQDNDSRRSFLALKENHRNDFTSRIPFTTVPSWSDASLGGLDHLDSPGAPRPTVYFAQQAGWFGSPDERTLGIAIQYWFLSAASSLPTQTPVFGNGFYFYHEGDLEMAQILLADPKGEGDMEAIAASTSQHYYGEGRPIEDIEMRDDTHPVFFVARGSHATHFDSGFFAHLLQRHGTDIGNEGFRGKLEEGILITHDEIASSEQSVMLKPGAGTRTYDLRKLNPGGEFTQHLLYWSGTLGKKKGLTFSGYDVGVPSIVGRHPKAPALGMYSFPINFHHAYNYSTENSVRAYFETERKSVAERIIHGRRLFALQRHTPSQCKTTEPIQPEIDKVVCPEEGQPEHLALYLESRKSEEEADPSGYFVCDSLGLEILTPENRQTFEPGDLISFEGSFEEMHCQEAPEIVWSSDLQGNLSRDLSFKSSGLEEGPHRITLSAERDGEELERVSVQIEVRGESSPSEPEIPALCAQITVGDAKFRFYNQTNAEVAIKFVDAPFTAVLNPDTCEVYGARPDSYDIDIFFEPAGNPKRITVVGWDFNDPKPIDGFSPGPNNGTFYANGRLVSAVVVATRQICANSSPPAGSARVCL